MNRSKQMMRFGRWMLLSAAIVLGAVQPAASQGSAAQAPKDIRPIEIVPVIQHSTLVNAAVLSPDGTRVLSASADSTLKLWDVATGRLIRTLDGHRDDVNAVVFLRDGLRAISGGSDKVLKLWDLATGKVLRTFDVGHTEKISSLALSHDGAQVISASFDKTIKVWDIASGRVLHTFVGHTAFVSSIAISPDGRRLISGDWDANLRLWDIASGRSLRTYKMPPKAWVMSVAFSPDGKRILSGHYDNSVRLSDTESGQVLRSFVGHAKSVLAVALSSDGKQAMSAGFEKALYLWDAASGKQISKFDTEDYPFWSLAFTPDGKVLAGAGAPMLVDPKTGKIVREFKGTSSRVAAVEFVLDGTRALSNGNDRTLKLWDLRTGRLLSNTPEGDQGRALALAPDATTVLSVTGTREMRLLEIATGKVIRTFDVGNELVNSAVLSRDGSRLASGGMNKTIKIWDTATARVLRTFAATPHGTGSVAFSPDGTKLASGSYDIRTIPKGFDTALRIWDVASGKQLRTLNGHTNQIQSVVFSRDGSRIVSGSSDHTVKLWDAATGNVIRTFTGHASNVHAVNISPDGTRLLSASRDKTIKLWDVASGRVLRTFEGNASEVSSAVFSPDGKRVMSAGYDGTVRVWDLETGGLLVSLLGTTSGEWLAITPEGFFAASDNGAGMLSVVRGLDVYSIDQFYQSLYRPDLVREKLAGDARGLVREAAARLDLDKALATGGAPDVRLVSPADGTRATGQQITAEIDLTPRDGGIGRVEWRVNGVTVGVDNPPAPPPAGQPARLTRGLALAPGNNEIAVVAYNGANLVASAPARATVVVAAPAPTVAVAPARLFVLAVGINEYADPKFKLSYAIPDADALAKAFVPAGKGLYADVKVTIVKDAQARRGALDGVFAKLAGEILPTDTFVFFLAGHGKTVDGRYYFIPQDFRLDGDRSSLAVLNAAVVSQGISQEQWQRWFASIPARKSVMLFDTCESGTLTGDSGETQVLERAAGNDRLAQATGRSVLTASGGDAEALEGYRDHGLFTYTVLDGLERADSDGNGTVEVAELAAFVHAQVTTLSEQVFKHRQVPQMRITSNDALAKPMRSLPVLASEFVIQVKPTHQVSTASELLVVPTLGAQRVRQLAAKTPVTLVKSDAGWTLVAREGRPLGYVATQDLTPMR
ncbi:MAG: hypothetical protein JWN71_3821 [Xanthobacteraceae bacterium]|nr:hypothetical protein [Xanthobacteraceae bacterium]